MSQSLSTVCRGRRRRRHGRAISASCVERGDHRQLCAGREWVRPAGRSARSGDRHIRDRDDRVSRAHRAESATAVAGGYLPAACPNPDHGGAAAARPGRGLRVRLSRGARESFRPGRSHDQAARSPRLEQRCPRRCRTRSSTSRAGPETVRWRPRRVWSRRAWNAERDLVVLEQRGTLKSEPLLACPELDTYLDGAVGSPPTSSDVAAQESEALQACRDRIAADGLDLAAYNTTENAADVADLRVALGIEESNVYGVSYGTVRRPRAAAQPARRHPGRRARLRRAAAGQPDRRQLAQRRHLLSRRCSTRATRNLHARATFPASSGSSTTSSPS